MNVVQLLFSFQIGISSKESLNENNTTVSSKKVVTISNGHIKWEQPSLNQQLYHVHLNLCL